MNRTIAPTGRLEKISSKYSYLNAVGVREHSKRKQTGRFFLALALGESFHKPQEVVFCTTRVEVSGCKLATRTCVYSTGSKCNASCM